MVHMSEIANLREFDWFLFAAIVLPGFLSIQVWTLIHPSEDRLLKDVLLDAVAFSVVNAALLWIPISLAPQVETLWLRWVLILLIFVVAPLSWPKLLDVLLTKAASRGWILSRHRTAWDDFFARRRPCWVIVHLADGRRIGGYFGAKSYATLFPQSGHIYIEELWSLNEETGAFETAVPDSNGIVLRPGDYHFVEIKGVQETS